tara:strand:- start:892 stop:1383 length:492 start_codon:yes stop_codon:yes gene_type:complete
MKNKEIGIKKIIKLFTCQWRFMFFSLWKLPMAFLARLKVSELSFKASTVMVPYNYWNKNPFNSMYFAVQAMAAELSTGTLVILHSDGKNVSMLVTGLTSKYHKKATTKIKFICLDGEKIKLAIKNAIETGEPQICDMQSKGYDMNDICVSEFDIKWSLKKRQS